MSSNVLKSGYVGISADVLTEDPTERASVKQTIMPELLGQMWSANSFFKISILPWLKEYRQEQLVLMVYSVPEYKLGTCTQFPECSFLLLLISCTVQKNQFPHSFQNTVTQTAVGAGRSAGDVEQGVCQWTTEKKESHSHKHTFPDTGGFCL